jgi:hypothetical protein
MMIDVIRAYSATFPAGVAGSFYGHSKGNVLRIGNTRALRFSASLTTKMRMDAFGHPISDL